MNPISTAAQTAEPAVAAAAGESGSNLWIPVLIGAGGGGAAAALLLRGDDEPEPVSPARP
jgi:hypothetical protein